jgi:Ca2+-binding EF-hand superfamily protein
MNWFVPHSLGWSVAKMARCLECLVLLVLLASGLRQARADEAGRTGERLVVLAPQRPVFVRLEAQVDGESLDAVRIRYARKIVEQHDADGDGFLNRDEAARVPPLVRTGVAAEEYSLVDTWVSVDASPPDDRLSAEELQNYLNRILGNPLTVATRPQRSSQQVDLVTLLDVDEDGGISREEMRAAPARLQRHDFDEDDILAVDELDGRSLTAGPVPRGATESPIFSMGTPEERELIARQLLNRYGTLSDSGERVLPIGRWTTANASPDQAPPTLTGPEIAPWLQESFPDDLVLGLRWNRKKRQRMEWVIVADPEGLVIPEKDEKSPTPRLQLRLPGLAIDLAIGRQTGTASDARNFFRTRLRQLDANKDRVLDEGEFGGLIGDLQSNGLSGVTFRMVDTDRDGRVTDAEIQALIDQDSGAQQTKIDLVISHDSDSLFEILAGRVDRRLTLRKLVEGYTRLQSRDQDGDGVVRSSEIAGKYRLTAEPGKPAMFRSNPRMMRPPPEQTVVATGSRNGPAWFHKMDRNQDGDVSALEFLGSRELFSRLDQDGDGLLSVEEATQADSSSPRKTEP